MRQVRRSIALLTALALLVSAGRSTAGPDGPSKLEFRGAEKRLEDFEAKVKRMKGQPFRLMHNEQEALRRIKALKEKHPADAAIEALFQRARAAILASKGKAVEISPAMLAYRENEQKLKSLFAEQASTAWAKLQEKVKTAEGAVLAPWPPPDHREVPVDDLMGKYVVLDDFRYPMNEFSELGRQMVFVGSPARGYYYVELSSRAWIGAYEAYKRYRRFVNRDVPEGKPWTLVGRITGLELIVPQTGEEKTMSAFWGWTVEPAALWVEGCTLATADPKLELGGSFAGEARMEDVKSSLYTVREVPKDVTPERLTEIFVSAIKEKNYPLFLDCIDPERRTTPTARDRILYHWDLHQQRFATFYCLVVVGKAETRTIQGIDASEDDIESKFLDPKELEELKKRAGPLVKAGELTTSAYDERGRQYGSPKPRFFKKVDKGRWYITNYAQPF